MGHAGCQLTERGQFFGLNELSLSLFQFLMGNLEFLMRLFQTGIQTPRLSKKIVHAHFFLGQTLHDGDSLLAAGAETTCSTVQIPVGIGFAQLGQNSLDLFILRLWHRYILNRKAASKVHRQQFRSNVFIPFPNLFALGLKKIHNDLLSARPRYVLVHDRPIDTSLTEKHIEKLGSDGPILQLLDGPYSTLWTRRDHIIQIHQVLFKPDAFGHSTRDTEHSA